MHILIFNWQDRTHPQGGGAETHLHEIFSRIAASGHRVTLACCRYEGATEREELDGITVLRRGDRNTFNYSVPGWYRSEFAKSDVDIVIDDINKIPFFTPLFVKKPLLALVHHFFGDSLKGEVSWAANAYVQLFERRIPRVYRRTPIVVVSESTKRECVERGFAPDNISVIHNAIDHRLYPMRVMEKAAAPTIVSFGRLKRYKAVDHVIQALHRVREVVPNARLEILGTGDDEGRLRSLVTSLQLDDAVTFHGFVSHEEKVRILSSAWVVASTSVKEGWGISTIEANACGTSAVSADVPGLRDSVRDNETGLLYVHGDIDTLTSHLTRILRDKATRERLQLGALRWASSFTWERSAREMLDRCEQVIAAHRGPWGIKRG